MGPKTGIKRRRQTVERGILRNHQKRQDPKEEHTEKSCGKQVLFGNDLI